jgi:hypothetical protein
MFTLTAGYIGENPDDYIGEQVEFPDYHGRTVTGTLEYAESPARAAYAALRVNGRTRTVFRNTVVQVGA